MKTALINIFKHDLITPEEFIKNYDTICFGQCGQGINNCAICCQSVNEQSKLWVDKKIIFVICNNCACGAYITFEPVLCNIGFEQRNMYGNHRTNGVNFELNHLKIVTHQQYPPFICEYLKSDVRPCWGNPRSERNISIIDNYVCETVQHNKSSVIIENMINNYHLVLQRYKHCNSILFICAHDDITSLMNMLSFDIILFIIKLMY